MHNMDLESSYEIKDVVSNLNSMNVTLNPKYIMNIGENDGIPQVRSIEDYVKLRAYTEAYTDKSTLDIGHIIEFNCDILADGMSAYFDSKPYVHNSCKYNATKPRYVIMKSLDNESTYLSAYAGKIQAYMDDMAEDNYASMSYLDLVYFLALADAHSMVKYGDIINRSFETLTIEAKAKAKMFRADSEIIDEYDYRMNMLNQLHNCADILSMHANRKVADFTHAITSISNIEVDARDITDQQSMDI